MKRITVAVLVVVMVLGMVGCSNMSRKQKGAVVGAGAGAAAGAVIGNAAGNTAVGAILGAAIGGAAGAYIGNQMDKQAAEMQRDLEGAKIERIGEGIKITFDSGILFNVDSSELQPAAKTNLSNLAQILAKYPDTNILIEGHTDATGSENYNMILSSSRAQSVANDLASLGINVSRFTIMAYGETQPIASNDTAAGRAQNRRVELAIYANDKLKKAAEAQAG